MYNGNFTGTGTFVNYKKMKDESTWFKYFVLGPALVDCH